MTTFSPSGDTRYKLNLATFASEVNRVTQGRISIELFPAGALVPNEEMPNALRSGAVQVIHSVGSYWATTMPVGNVEYYMPMSYANAEDTWTVMWDRGMQDLLRKAYAEQNAYFLTFEVGSGSFLMTKDPVNTLQDIKGKKIRAIGTAGDFVTRLGASAANINMGEIYMALKTGTVDGAALGYEQLDALKIQEICKYLTFPGFFMGQPLDILINLDAWNSLPEDLKIIMELEGRNFSIWSGMLQSNKDHKASTKNFQAAGVNFVNLSDADIDSLQQKATELWDDWAKKDNYCNEAVNIYKAYLKDQGRLK
jgi:TRAP-type C4-dicarboxylate transport system substrate-binding protein